MAKQLATAVILMLVLATRPAFGAEAVLGGSCNLDAVGAPEAQGFLAFDQELRAALSRNDPAAMALLVAFPLGVNHPDGSKILLGNAAALQSRFSEVFTPTVRSAVLKQKLDAVFCNYTGIMYGKGEVWIRADVQGKELRYRVAAVNLPAGDIKQPIPRAPKLLFVCDAEAYRVVIDSIAGGTLRYRAWNKPRSLTAKPDMEIASGAQDTEGTGPCAHGIWTFKKGSAEYTVSTLGCTEGSPPPGVTGDLEVSIGGKPEHRWWCY